MNPVWIIFAILVLAVINYLLLYDKRSFIIDCGLIAAWVLNFCCAGYDMDVSFTGNGYLMIFIFFSFLIFASIRVLWRRELKSGEKSSLLLRRKAFILTALGVIILLWCAVFFINPAFRIYMADKKNTVCRAAFALKEYARDNGSRYPGSLDELIPGIPGYVKKMPQRNLWIQPDEDIDAHRLREFCSQVVSSSDGSSDEDTYEVNDERTEFTLRCAASTADEKSGAHFIYSSRKGFFIAE